LGFAGTKVKLFQELASNMTLFISKNKKRDEFGMKKLMDTRI